MRSFIFLASPLLLSLSAFGLPLAVIDTLANNTAIDSNGPVPVPVLVPVRLQWCCGKRNHCPCRSAVKVIEIGQTNNTAINITPASGMKAVKQRQIDTTTSEASILS